MNKEMLAPIVFFAYKRPDHAKHTLESLSKSPLAKGSNLFAYIDGPKESDPNEREEVLSTVRIVQEFKNAFKNLEVKCQTTNLGLARSIISGVTEVIEQYGKAIVFEDDLEVSEHGLSFLNNALDFYEKQERVMNISAYCPPPETLSLPSHYKHDVFFNVRGGSWGWATWADRWKLADWEVSDYEAFRKNPDQCEKFNLGGEDLVDMLDSQMKGRIDSWFVRWIYSQFRVQKLSVFPVDSYVNNLGFDGSGTHFSNASPKVGSFARKFRTDISRANPNPKFLLPVELNPEVLQAWQNSQRRSPIWHFKKRLRDLGVVKGF